MTLFSQKHVCSKSSKEGSSVCRNVNNKELLNVPGSKLLQLLSVKVQLHHYSMQTLLPVSVVRT